MDFLESLSLAKNHCFKCVDMHTTGEPTRIVYSGWPSMSGTLIQQRAQAEEEHDQYRKCLILEPRGHFNMYGALLRPETELTQIGEAHMGVLFMTNDGYSTMCGHATIALGRFLIDTHDKAVFPRRDEVKYDAKSKTAFLKLHAPCGLVEVTVPALREGNCADPSRPVSFISAPAFATGVGIQIDLPPERRWAQLSIRGHDAVIADFAYGGAFFCVVTAEELGFPKGLRDVDFDALNHATRQLKVAVNETPLFPYLFRHPEHEELGFLYSIMVIDERLGEPLAESRGAEMGLCFFADQEIDRSPTGSGVAARVALACELGQLQKGESLTYHSLLSNSWKGRGGFVGTLVDKLGEIHDHLTIVKAKIQGHASYTGFSAFIIEQDDPVHAHGGGFIFEKL
jgi:trans-L-3-hydroxyproline dehydratase